MVPTVGMLFVNEDFPRSLKLEYLKLLMMVLFILFKFVKAVWEHALFAVLVLQGVH